MSKSTWKTFRGQIPQARDRRKEELICHDIEGIQRRSPKSTQVNSSYANFDHSVFSGAVRITGIGSNVEISFPDEKAANQGVGLNLPADAAVSVAHLLLAVSAGDASRVEGNL